MSEILYLDMADVLALHARQVERFGGADGIRDAGLLDAAINRPQSGYYADIFEQAAALWESLTMNHCFVDGNKRVGFASVYVFLRLNGVRIAASEADTLSFILRSIETGTFTKDKLDAWLRANTVES
ncbi:MAG: type II toxin-antitoxin system death-on-curing family toxin [Hoeflea sp.]|uniref:type II toxin-antitoxin system death-on-curing family toxin n=1 Tax=Hoeflea sp. TaxID=1940281 RepID=UPI000C104642|nr:type II toxin-antitoxin system death-on-curing family toxin [Hoeflea sp.]PHR22392.1 MAG: type II toxin-antitoxin system death-on-curing family toxin [Hoeflea sp.]